MTTPAKKCPIFLWGITFGSVINFVFVALIYLHVISVPSFRPGNADLGGLVSLAAAATFCIGMLAFDVIDHEQFAWYPPTAAVLWVCAWFL